MNGITLFAATHNKLKNAVDGIGTRVATCMINKWMAKINGKKVYNIRGPPRTKAEKRKTVAVLTTHESFCN